VTTATFSPPTDFAETVSDSLVLVDGARLTQLMIEHKVGVSVPETLPIPAIDRDYFEV
jgi:restriction system protein